MLGCPDFGLIVGFGKIFCCEQIKNPRELYLNWTYPSNSARFCPLGIDAAMSFMLVNAAYKLNRVQKYMKRMQSVRVAGDLQAIRGIPEKIRENKNRLDGGWHTEGRRKRFSNRRVSV